MTDSTDHYGEKGHRGSGREGRIRAEYRGLKKRWDYRNSGLPALWLFLARKHRMPVQSVKRICKPDHFGREVQP